MNKLNQLLDGNEKMRTVKQFAFITIGNLIFSWTMNTLVTPFNIYCSGAMGVAQLIELFFKSTLHISSLAGIGLLGIIFWGISIPAFIYGMKNLGIKFLAKTVYSITVMSIFIAIIPVSEEPIIENKVMGCMVAAVIGGFALGYGTFSSGAGAGASDCIGMVLAQKKPGFSIGLMNMLVNICVYGICAFIYGIEGAAFSIFYAAVLAWAMDKSHLQNHYIQITMYTKISGISKDLSIALNRGVTTWQAEGGYTGTPTYMSNIIVTKYELDDSVAKIREVDKDAFISVYEIGKVHGLFDKHLSQ